MSGSWTSRLLPGYRTVFERADNDEHDRVLNNGLGVAHGCSCCRLCQPGRESLLISAALSLVLACSTCTQPTPRTHGSADSQVPRTPVPLEEASATAVAQGSTTGDPAAPSAADAGTSEPSEDTFLGGVTPRRVAIVDFETRGTVRIQDAGQIVADHIQAHLSPRWFTLIERAQLRRLLDEHDLRTAGIVEGDGQQTVGQLANVTHLVVGSVAEVDDITVDARLVDVATGEIVRRASGAAGSVATLPAALDEIAAVLSASDATYVEIERKRLSKQAMALDAHPEITRTEDGLVIRFRIRHEGKTDLLLFREARQKLRDLYVSYCRDQLHLTASKASLQDFCREHEECEDVRTIGGAKEFIFRVPLPN